MIFNYLEESGLGNRIDEIIAEALEPIIEEIRKGEIKMFKDNNTVSTGTCGEPVHITGVADMCHKTYAIVQENANLAERIHDFMFGSKNVNTCGVGKDDPSCMTEELAAIMFELDRLHVILLDINSRL